MTGSYGNSVGDGDNADAGSHADSGDDSRRDEEVPWHEFVILMRKIMTSLTQKMLCATPRPTVCSPVYKPVGEPSGLQFKARGQHFLLYDFTAGSLSPLLCSMKIIAITLLF